MSAVYTSGKGLWGPVAHPTTGRFHRGAPTLRTNSVFCALCYL